MKNHISSTAGQRRAQELYDQLDGEIAIHHEVAHEIGLMFPCDSCEASTSTAGPTLDSVVASHLSETSKNLFVQMQASEQVRKKLLAERQSQRMNSPVSSDVHHHSARDKSRHANARGYGVVDVEARDITPRSAG